MGIRLAYPIVRILLVPGDYYLPSRRLEEREEGGWEGEYPGVNPGTKYKMAALTVGEAFPIIRGFIMSGQNQLDG